MSLFDSVSRTVKGLLNDAAESVQDPSRDARQIVRELDDSIGKAENALIEIEAQVATQQSKRDAAAEKAKKYEDGAKRALQSGDEGLAREALAAQANAETERDALAKELATLVPSVDQLKQPDRRHASTPQRFERPVEHPSGQAGNRASEGCRGHRTRRHWRQESVGRFPKLEDKVALSNARSDARLNSADTRSGKALDDKLAELDHGPSVEDRLEALKKQINANTPAQ